jgi:surfeit locus 1 family protein
MAAAMLGVLVWLGVWQLHRLAWKQGILAAIAHAERSPPVPLPPVPARFQKVRLDGTIRPGLSLLYGSDVRDTPQGPTLGAQLIQPLFRAAGPPVLVDRGWIPETGAIAAASQLALPLDVVGYVRPPEHPGAFSARDDAATRRFFTLDPKAMGAALGLNAVAPFVVVAIGADTGTPPIPADTLPRPPNDHLQYALTWFGLAGVLCFVYGQWLLRSLGAGKKGLLF